jgi:hypothetical protein
MNIYVPAAYMKADGALTNKVFNGYTAETAPIIYANGVGGYSQADPEAWLAVLPAWAAALRAQRSRQPPMVLIRAVGSKSRRMHQDAGLSISR